MTPPPREPERPASAPGPPARVIAFALVLAAAPALLFLRSIGWPLERSADGPPEDAVPVERPTGILTLPTLDSVSGTLHRDVFSVTDAARLPTGGWVVLDRLAARLHFLDADGELLRSVAGPGPGPAELERPMAVVPADTFVVVIDALGRRLDLFDRQGDFVRRIQTRQADCPASPLASATAGPDGLLLLVSCPVPPLGSAARLLHVRLDDGAVSVAARTTVRDPDLDEVEVIAFPLLAVHEGRAYLGVGPTRCLDLVSAATEDRASALCHPPLPRPPFPDSVRSAVKARLAGRTRMLGLRLRFPEVQPLFERTRSGPWGVAFELTLRDGRRVVDLLPRGETRLRRLLPPPDHRLFPGTGEVLLAKPVLEGTLLRIVPVDG